MTKKLDRHQLKSKKSQLTENDLKLWRALEQTLEQTYRPTPDFSTLKQKASTSAPKAPPSLNLSLISQKATTHKSEGTKPHEPHTSLTQSLEREIKRGRRAPTKKLDLHGETQDSAHRKLIHFITQARSSNHKLVLVVTGKGAGGDGILKRNVPRWLTTPPLSQEVISFGPARPEHGGEGALYIHVRTKQKP